MEWTIGWWQISVQRIYPTTQQLSQTYNQAASWWHQHLRLLGYDHAYQALWRWLKNAGMLPSLKENSRICDCGVGTAALSLSLVQTIHSTLQITGVDISSEMLNTADQKLNDAKITHHLCCSDVRNLPFGDRSFDGVISAHMLEHLSNPKQGLQEMVRILRPNAPLILVVTRVGLLGSLIEWHWGNRCFSQKELVALMQKAGLTNVQFIPFPIGLAYLSSMACIGFRRADTNEKQNQAALRIASAGDVGCWCANRLPHTVVQQMENAYRAILIKQHSGLENDSIFETALVRVCGYWMLNTLTRHLESALRNNLNWGISTIRQRILARLEAFITTAQEFNQFSGLRGTTSKLLERLRQQWSDVPDLPLYPAFQKK